MIYLQLFWEFMKVGLFTFGGGMAAFPFLLEVSEKTGWFTKAQLVNMTAISQSTPGPIGINTATYAGYLTAGIPGAVIATLGMILPTAAIALIVAKFLQSFRNSKYVVGAMYGLRPASAGLIASAGISVALLSLVNTAAFKAHAWASVIDPKSLVLAAVLIILTNNVNKTKNLHPVFYIVFSGVIGVLFHFAGV